MSVFDIIAFIAMAIVFFGLIYLVIWLGDLPANIARKGNHPQVAAVQAMSWLGLILTGGIVWILAFVWAYYDYAPNKQAQTTELEALQKRIVTLENALAKQGDKS